MNPILKAERYVKDAMKDDITGHDWYHVDRVRRNALKIAHKEGGDRQVIELAALLHDIGDHKFHGGKSQAKELLEIWFDSQKVQRELKEQVIEIVESISYSKGHIPDSLEGKIVQDADRLDAIGAIGIARCFAYGAYKKRPIYDPSNDENSLQHFEDKLLRLYDLLNTQTGKIMAKQRHDLLKTYKEAFLEEWGV